MDISEECKRMRIRAGMSMQDVQDFFGISAKTIANWEKASDLDSRNTGRLTYMHALNTIFGEVIGNAEDHKELTDMLKADMKRMHIDSYKRYVVFRKVGGVYHYRGSYERMTPKFRHILDKVRNANIRDLEKKYAVIDTENQSLNRQDIRKTHNSVIFIAKKELDSRLYD